MSTLAPSRADLRPPLKRGILTRSASVGLALILSLVFFGPGSARSIKIREGADFILIVKHERKLYLLHDNDPMRSYRIALGLSPTGAKEGEWDFRTPEGSYVIDFRLEHSHYFKALHISYPSQVDLERSSVTHRPAGGDIFIHGEPNLLTKPLSYYRTRDWTNGCIALSNEDLQELWDLTAGQTPVEIVP